jgi:hypothetical protein
MSTQQPSEEEMRAALEEQMKRITVQDVRSLLPLLPQEADLGPVRDALSQLQMAYVQLAGPQTGEATGADGEAETAAAAPEQAASEKPAPSPADEAERAKARSKIWTPPGA